MKDCTQNNINSRSRGSIATVGMKALAVQTASDLMSPEDAARYNGYDGFKNFHEIKYDDVVATGKSY